jgi:hypothetical protein
MNLNTYRRPLIAIGLLTVVGAVGAQTYYTHELARRVAAYDSTAPAAASTPAPSPSSSPSPNMDQWDPWTAMHADMMRLQSRMERMFDEAFTLPGPVTASGMHTQFQDGVLTVTIPKA